jgi:glutamine amidotransferase-like uncharacterized protein
MMKGRIALFLHQPKCSIQSGNGIMRARSTSYSCKIFTRHELEADFFADVDMICIPGGFGDASSFDYLLGVNGQRVKDFVSQGGRFLGICMGAYWAGQHYLNMLKDVDAEQYITRPGTDTRRPHAKNIKINWNGSDTEMFFYDGCALIGNGKFDTIATYANGDAMAIIQDRIGLIGCHPESEKNWYDSYSWMQPHWHDYKHHTLLLEFVDQLMQS